MFSDIEKLANWSFRNWFSWTFLIAQLYNGISYYLTAAYRDPNCLCVKLAIQLERACTFTAVNGKVFTAFSHSEFQFFRYSVRSAKILFSSGDWIRHLWLRKFLLYQLLRILFRQPHKLYWFKHVLQLRFMGNWQRCRSLVIWMCLFGDLQSSYKPSYNCLEVYDKDRLLSDRECKSPRLFDKNQQMKGALQYFSSWASIVRTVFSMTSSQMGPLSLSVTPCAVKFHWRRLLSFFIDKNS